jgi:hypothetical protein
MSLFASEDISRYASPTKEAIMALADSINKHIKTDNKCTARVILEMLSETDAKELNTHLAKGTPTMTLVAALRSEGYHIAEATLNKHRSGLCKCPKDE